MISLFSRSYILLLIFLGALAWCASFLGYEISTAFAFLPFVMGPCADACSSDGSNSGSDSDGGGGSGSGGSGDGTGEGSTGDCSCCESSCGDCCNSGDDGGGGGGESSSPFLFLFDGMKYVVENDVLVGPKTYVETPDEGMIRHKAGHGGADTYLVEEGSLDTNGETIKLSLKEIEPEETFLDSVTLTKIMHPQGVMLATTPRRDGFLAFRKSELEETRGVTNISVVRRGGEAGIATKVGDIKNEQMLETGEAFEVHATLLSKDVEPIFCLRSRYRDWVAGTIDALEKEKVTNTPSPFFQPARVVRRAISIALTPVLFLASGLTGGDKNDTEGINTLTDHVGFRTASADTPHYGDSDWKSLVVDYWDWSRSRFVQLDVVQPRYQKALIDAVSVPADAIDHSGKVHLRVTATKRHAVDLATLFVPSEVGEEYTATTQKLSLVGAKHSRGITKDLSRETAAETGAYMHLIPGDELKLEFENNKTEEGMISTYQISFKGFYSKLTPEGERQAGDWTSKLDPAAYTQLKEMYALSSYSKKTRTPVVK